MIGCLIYLLCLPNVSELKKSNPKTTALIELRKKQAAVKKQKLQTQYFWVPMSGISDYLVQAVILAEDDTFYQHHGFDWEQIQLALHENWKKKKYSYGASTITQQLARTLYLSPGKHLYRKIKEAFITVQLEHTLSKKRILELYLNVAEWGKGIYGVQAAAEYYFGKSAIDLTPDESIALASILPSPRRWSPFSERAFMARRRTQLHELMEANGLLPNPDIESDSDNDINPVNNLQGNSDSKTDNSVPVGNP